MCGRFVAPRLPGHELPREIGERRTGVGLWLTVARMLVFGRLDFVVEPSNAPHVDL